MPLSREGAPRFAALRSRNFRIVWISLIVSNAGSQMQTAGQLWLVRDMAEEPIYLGLLSASFGIPMLLVTPWGGSVVDRFPRVRVLKLTRTAMMGLTLVLTALTWTGRVELWHLLLLSFLSACMLAIDNPGRQ